MGFHIILIILETNLHSQIILKIHLFIKNMKDFFLISTYKFVDIFKFTWNSSNEYIFI